MKTKTNKIILDIFKNICINSSTTPSDFMSKAYNYYLQHNKINNNLNGLIFEELMKECLLFYNIYPFYVQAKMTYIPNVVFDIIIYDRYTPISISLKSSLRERWKQADLEALAMKYVHRKAKCFLISNSSKEILTRKKLSNSYIGLDDFIDINKSEFNKFIYELCKFKPKFNENLPVFESFVEVTKKDSKV